MREILFRGKRTGGIDKWIEGTGLFNDGINTWLSFNKPNWPVARSMKYCAVLPETCGQFTGLYDKNGAKIFEGDIVKGKDYLEEGLEIYGYIDHRNGSFVIVGDFIIYYRWLDYEVEVIGNIHDNPELLERETE